VAVTEINLRNVTIRQIDNEYGCYPNSRFIDNPFTNYSLTRLDQELMLVGVGYEAIYSR
jgi:small conductance mechanosensitive channel